MSKSKLLKEFLSGFPNSTHPLDRNRFVAYAIECARSNHYIDIDEMKANGVWDKNIEDYETAYEWIRDTVDFLSKEKLP